jgi:hypothetical protein
MNLPRRMIARTATKRSLCGLLRLAMGSIQWGAHPGNGSVAKGQRAGTKSRATRKQIAFMELAKPAPSDALAMTAHLAGILIGGFTYRLRRNAGSKRVQAAHMCPVGSGRERERQPGAGGGTGIQGQRERPPIREDEERRVQQIGGVHYYLACTWMWWMKKKEPELQGSQGEQSRRQREQFETQSAQHFQGSEP